MKAAARARGGAGDHGSASPLALAIIGGLLTSTIITLVLVPALYRLSAGVMERMSHGEEETEGFATA